jgi:hypothetical protein
MLPEAETIIQGVNVGIVLACFFVFYRAVREEGESPVPAKAKLAFLLSGVFLVGVGSLMSLFREGPLTEALLLKHIGFDTGAIAVGYSLVILSLVSVFASKTTGNPRFDS